MLVVGILLLVGIVFARDRVKRAFQLGALLYAIVLAVRFLVFGFGDPDNFLDIMVVVGVFFLIWLVAWGGTQLLLRARQRPDEPST